MFTFSIFSLHVLLSVALLLSEKKIKVQAYDECSSNSDCGYNEYCCKQEYSWQTNVCGYGDCVGQSCSSDSDCGGPGECCSSSNYCTSCYKTTASPYECSSNSDCGYNKYCCKQEYPWQTNVCGYGSCVGKSCSSDSDCGGPGECCSSRNYCTKSGCDLYEIKALASWLIAVIVVSILVALFIPIAIVVRCYRGMASASRGRTRQGQVVNQPTGSTIALQHIQTVQIPPPAYFTQDQDLPTPQPQIPPPAYTTA